MLRNFEDLKMLERQGYSLLEQAEAVLASSPLLEILENKLSNLQKLDSSWKNKLELLVQEGFYHPWKIQNRKVAIISDIHANLEALEVVLKDIKRQKITEIICLGDIIGFGPNPVECVQLVLERCQIVLKGDHEEFFEQTPLIANEYALKNHKWIHNQFKDSYFLFSKKKKKLKDFLKNLPLMYNEQNILFVHGSPREPTMEWILKSDCEAHSEKLNEIFSLVERLCFFGHNHIAGAISNELQFIVPDKALKIDPKEKYLISVGSVGQPRDRDYRACYTTFDGEEVRWNRLEYEVQITQQKIEKNKTLDAWSAQRLSLGV